MPCPIHWYPDADPTGQALDTLQAITAGLTETELRYDEPWLARIVFTKGFMPYAKRHWAYGAACNCEDLAQAFQLVWYWVQRLRARLARPVPPCLLRATKDIQPKPCITKGIFRLFAPAGETGNVRGPDGVLNGQCYFALHTVCKIGSVYFDPTFDRFTTRPTDLIEREVERMWSVGDHAVLVSSDLRYIYTRNPVVCGPFADSWNEIAWAEGLKHRGQVPRLPDQERIPASIWQDIIRRSAAIH